MVYCEKCGAAISDGYKFCKKCGNKVETFEQPQVETVVVQETIEENKEETVLEDVFSVELEKEKEVLLTKRKIEVGKEIVEKYKKETKVINFSTEHWNLYQILKGIIFFVPGFIFGLLYYFIFRFLGHFDFWDFALSTVLGGLIFVSFSDVFDHIYALIHLLYTASWLKKSTYGDGKKSDSNFACSSVLSYKEIGLAFIEKSQIYKESMRMSVVLRSMMFLKSSKIKTIFIFRSIVNIIFAVIRIVPFILLYICLVPIFFNVIQVWVYHIYDWNLSPLLAVPFVISIVIFIVVLIVDSIIKRVALKKYKNYEKELIEKYKDAKEE